MILIVILKIMMYAVTALMLGSVIISWFPRLRWYPIGRLIYQLSEAPLQVVRRFLRPLNLGGGVGLDFSPLVFYLLVLIVYNIIVIFLIKLFNIPVN